MELVQRADASLALRKSCGISALGRERTLQQVCNGPEADGHTPKSVEDEMDELPHAGIAHDDATRKRIDNAVSAGNLARASNNTRWDELISYFRNQTGWRPSYRSKSVTGNISGWDVEWFYHLPFPFASVEWFDIGLYEGVSAEGRLLKPRVIDHTEEISNVVQAIGFEFEVRGDVLRIWGYLPKSYEDFPPA
ncbi:hypothetical protein MASSI9I_70367 [Massilia sp. 9I]|nr:hypothetical protein MASSI9I_70367 [Massilia sp. 9I]